MSQKALLIVFCFWPHHWSYYWKLLQSFRENRTLIISCIKKLINSIEFKPMHLIEYLEQVHNPHSVFLQNQMTFLNRKRQVFKLLLYIVIMVRGLSTDFKSSVGLFIILIVIFMDWILKASSKNITWQTKRNIRGQMIKGKPILELELSNRK